jgi:hypothetical protein
MEVSSPAAQTSPSTAAQVKVFTKANKQQEAVVNTIMQGVQESAPRAPEQSGQRLNIPA